MGRKIFFKTEGTPLEDWGRIAPKPGESIAVYAMSNIAKRLIPAYISMGLKVTRILDRDPVIAPDEFVCKDYLKTGVL